MENLLKQLEVINLEKYESSDSVCESLCRYNWETNSCPKEENVKICDIADHRSELYVAHYFPKLSDLFKKL